MSFVKLTVKPVLEDFQNVSLFLCFFLSLFIKMPLFLCFSLSLLIKMFLFLCFSLSTALFPYLVIVEEQRQKSEIKFYNSKECYSGDLSE